MQEGSRFLGFPTVLAGIFIAATCIKALLIPSYRSTDFDVHRNWLAVTHSLPLSQWYYDATSEWTLDYPPLFAWFELLLSYPAALVDPLIVNIKHTNYASPSCVLYQRFTVIFSDLTLLYALHQYYKYQASRPRAQDRLLATTRSLVVGVFVLLNYGLLVVDHIHFQYNGFLFGLQLLSIVRVMQGRLLEGGFWFAVLLNLKHIFLYVAPAYFVYLLRHFCFHGNSPSSASRFLPPRFLMLGGMVVGVFLLSFGPFMWLGQLGQVLSRLFPFKRGLCHAYWAPNVWALYSFADIVAAALGQRFGLLSGSCDSEGCGGGMTSGLVGEMGFKVLPEVPPWLTLAITALSMMPSLFKVWLDKEACPLSFLKLLILCAYSSYLFGWHVHEKAVLLITLPMSFLAAEEVKFTSGFLFLSMAAHVSLFPLLHQLAETPVKLSLFVLCTCMSWWSYGEVLSFPPAQGSAELSQAAAVTPAPADAAAPPPQLRLKKQQLVGAGFSWLQFSFMALVLLVQVYCVFLHWCGPLKRLQFLPLMLTSVTCAGAVLLSWGHFLVLFFCHRKTTHCH